MKEGIGMFPKNLKRIMKEKGITGAALAEAAGFSKAAVSQYIHGVNAPSQERVEAMAGVLGVSVEELVGMDSPPERPTGPPYGCAIQPAWPGKTTMTCQEAAALLHKHQSYIRQGLQEGRPGFEFGSAVKLSGKWSYCIYARKFTEVTGIPVPGVMEGGEGHGEDEGKTGGIPASFAGGGACAGSPGSIH